MASCPSSELFLRARNFVNNRSTLSHKNEGAVFDTARSRRGARSAGGAKIGYIRDLVLEDVYGGGGIMAFFN